MANTRDGAHGGEQATRSEALGPVAPGLKAAARAESSAEAREPQTSLPAETLAEAERRLCGLVNALSRRIEGHVREHASALGLTAPQAVALRELTGPMTLRELAERMCCEPSNATFVSDRLEEQGLVERRPHPSDRRAKQLVLTSEGAALRDRLIAALTRQSPLSRLSDREQDTLQELLLRAVVG
ncbi:hypothetical protein GCM10018785_00390 [Streptomyces longispororuber]|uniref:HTH marR-type domain-containing protein n=1 Tax=Streptomyces longispororuber TaxID=68230 RepID=A0A918Z2C2_9ACTN|nr:hypothetical protein GCM10018785_00390 [Streptomyces longispororuber]